MKVEISDEHYFELIKDIFEEIYVEIQRSTIQQNEFYYCELGDNKLSYYPNFSIYDGDVISPKFDNFNYLTQREKLEKLLLVKLNEKYEELFGQEVTYYSPQKLNDIEYGNDYKLQYHNPFFDSRHSTNAIFEEAIFQQAFCFLNIDIGDNVYNTVTQATDYIKRLKLGDAFTHFGIAPLIEKGSIPLKLLRKDIGYSDNNNIFINDVLLFLDINKKKVNTIIDCSNFKSLLKLESNLDKRPNPFIDLFYNVILTQFILFEKEFQNIAFQNKYSDFLKYDYYLNNDHNQERLIALSYEITSSLQSEEEKYFLPPFKYILTNQKISQLIYKAIVLVINQKVSEQNRYTQKFNSLFDLGTQEDINLSETYINRIKRIYEKANNAALFRSEISAKNIVTLFHLLKQHKAINYKLKDTEIRTLLQLLTSYSDNTLKEYFKELNKNIRDSSMEDGYLKSRAAENYKVELMELLEKMIADLKK